MVSVPEPEMVEVAVKARLPEIETLPWVLRVATVVVAKVEVPETVREPEIFRVFKFRPAKVGEEEVAISWGRERVIVPVALETVI